MNSNFHFLLTHRPEFHDDAVKAEQLVGSSPRASCMLCRFALEQAVVWLYANDKSLQRPYRDDLAALIHEPTFKDNLAPNLFPKIRLVWQSGNQAAHKNRKFASDDALQSVRDLFHFLYWLSRMYTEQDSHPEVNFNAALIDLSGGKAMNRAEILELEKALASKVTKLDELESVLRKKDEEIEAYKVRLEALKKRNEQRPDNHDWNEAETRKYLIDRLLEEAGWRVGSKDVSVERAVKGMPSSSTDGVVDYVLWGTNGLPMAVNEAKRTYHSAAKGKQQAQLYADTLEQEFSGKQRPIIYYTNGYDTFLWDDVRYPPRAVQGYHKRTELQQLIRRRSEATPLSEATPDASIVERHYQVSAIRSVCEIFQRGVRSALLVMATGTGKTRTAIALCKLVQEANWAKRILFLADRNSLVLQTKRAFGKFLPDVTAVDIRDDKSDPANAKLVLATYPSMMNRIESYSGTERVYGVGHFDLIIIDEAHRSVYKKYGAIFEYFDSLLLGLTATPHDQVHRDTYALFGLERGNPTSAYELPDAVKDGYLVEPRGIEVPFKFLSQGISYDELSEEEREEYEEKLYDAETDELPPHVDRAALNKWILNIDTVDKTLKLIMEYGLKVDAGDKLGKTIIFARNHKHAEFIVERFDANYPHLAGKFARVIDSHDDYAQSLLDDFSKPKSDPQIAVSVDMLDTGVDVPEVVNLVFFKPLGSRVKFQQMIGRGTRLCPDLFGPGEHKKEFYVFDICSNFEFFRQRLQDADVAPHTSITAATFRLRIQLLQHMAPSDKAELSEKDTVLRKDLADTLHSHVTALPLENFVVRPRRRVVEEFSERERWDTLSPEDAHRAAEQLAELPAQLPRENVEAKRWDIIILRLQLALGGAEPGFAALQTKVQRAASALEEKTAIPMVAKEIELIHALQTDEWWQDVTRPMLEHVRRHLRDLIQFIDRSKQKIVVTNFEDTMLGLDMVPVPYQSEEDSLYAYRQRVEKFIREHKNHLVIGKVYRNLPLTDRDLQALEQLLFSAEVAENREKFEQNLANGQTLPAFVRSLVGLDREAAKEAFGKFLAGTTYSAQQIRFIEQIINALTINGVMDPGLLYEPPFSEMAEDGIEGMFANDDVDTIISVLRTVNRNAGMMTG